MGDQRHLCSATGSESGADAGIMRICVQRSAGDSWNWRTNVASGRSILSASEDSAKNHLDAEAAKEGAKAYTTRYWREEAIHRYNAGTGSGNEYRIWLPGSDGMSGRWEVVDRGDIGGYVPALLNADCQ